MLFKPAQLGLAKLGAAELEADKKACKKIGPCGVGKKALYLNSFYIDRCYYLPYGSITRAFKRVAMSQGGFTGKGMFASMAYLVVEYDGGKQKQCNFKDERDVDALLDVLAKEQPQIKRLSAAGEQTVQKKEAEKAAAEQQDKGSVIIIIATDAPVSARQLQRVARRAQSGIARTGSISGNGSGEIALAFTTANRIPHYSPKKPIAADVLFEDDMDLMFRAAIECVEESVISSLTHAEHTKGFRGHEKECLAELL